MRTRKRLFVSLGLLTLMLLFSASGLAQKKNKNQQQAPQSNPPTIRLTPSTNVVMNCPGEGSVVQLAADAVSPQGLNLRYNWSATGGRIVGSGANTTWDFSGVQPGTYTVTVEVNSGREQDCTAFTQTAVVVRECPPPTCPSIVISCPDTVRLGETVTFRSSITNLATGITPIYQWTVSAGTITSGQGTPSITVDTTGLTGQAINARLSVGGFNLACSAQCTTQIPLRVEPRKFDEFGDIARDDEKARLDNFAIQLQQEPEAQGYIFVYTGTGRRIRPDYAQKRTARIRDYLINARGVDSRRIVILEGPPRSDPTVELWIVPPGATAPAPR
ncbi:MAG TPA: hypothetical protein VGO69_03190 [Pyrinomonadaceae bacterium]|nr:hypothetical protein [Pyrinomonadaceae bacterium]